MGNEYTPFKLLLKDIEDIELSGTDIALSATLDIVDFEKEPDCT